MEGKGNPDKDPSWPKPSCRVQHTLYACSSISITTITANPREFTGACHAMDSRCMQAAILAFSSHLAIHNIHPSIHPPLRSWRPAQRTYNSRDALWFSGWTMRSGHHRQNCSVGDGDGDYGHRVPVQSSILPVQNVISHVRKPKRERKSLLES